ncbi:TetR family transcriptional regulator [Leucobacter insecticola]|uniref:TetR family transcriptional regulator n=1 Tax=Leucobacter insecticola TaxID=2714934 RepID=A0A6G8FL90_9MICO|nr:TetR/AcrR family transcriptional regulator [Leucobacter insecticola]QIM17135.1 TetR family transcriptional regulator [Leucobacter insecticola]
MSSSRGRPHASSREMIADAACELFLEQGYDATTVTEITRRTGVSRSTFFNYFTSKSATLWFVLDEQIDALLRQLADHGITPADALDSFARAGAPETLALAIVDARNMGVEDELRTGQALRQLRIADAIAARLEREGEDPARARVIAAGYAAALLAAVWQWADLGAGRHDLGRKVGAALRTAREVLG